MYSALSRVEVFVLISGIEDTVSVAVCWSLLEDGEDTDDPPSIGVLPDFSWD